MKKAGCENLFTPSPNLKTILYNNKPEFLKNSHPTVYKLSCTCEGQHINKKIASAKCYVDHEERSMPGKWKSSGVTEHAQSCCEP